MNIRENLQDLRRRRGILVAAHRGTAGGNIIVNTIPAYENALRHGADIVEIDAAMTADGVFYCFHDGGEPLLLGTGQNIRRMESSFVEQLYLRNPYLDLSAERVNRLEDAFEHLRGRCLINIDRTWFYWKEIIAFIKKMGMEDQVILKSPPRGEDLELLETQAPDLGYMPILRRTEEAELAAKYRINYCMAELIFTGITDPSVDRGFIENLKSQGLLLWVNVITLNERLILSGGKDDRNAIMGSPDDHWGWCVDRGFDVLQTDWPLLLRGYLDGRKGSADLFNRE
jgi:glycerophosphoryl diester phosphodiesterase